MRIISDFSKKIDTPSAIALGYFDCIHPGHAAVIECAVRSQLTPVVFSFHMDGESPKGKLIISPCEKREIMCSMGVEFLTDFLFSEIKDMDAQTFFSQILVSQMNAKLLVCGADFKFGKNAGWGIDALRKMCVEGDVELMVIPDVCIDGIAVHSTAIRQAIESGNIADANRMLGRIYSYSGTIIHGNKLGRTVGMPTINIEISREYAMPKFGVYASRTRLGDRVFDSITNIGVKPTIGSAVPLYETHIFGFDEDVYGEMGEIYLYDFVRSEKKFESLQLVKNQVEIDIDRVKSILTLYK